MKGAERIERLVKSIVGVALAADKRGGVPEDLYKPLVDGIIRIFEESQKSVCPVCGECIDAKKVADRLLQEHIEHAHQEA